jgi:type II secretory pathway component PulM
MIRMASLQSIKPAVRALQSRFQALGDRDRRALGLGIALVGAILLVAVVSALTDRERATRDRIAQKSVLIAELPARLAAVQRLERLGGDAALPVASLAQRLTERAGIAAIVESTGDGGVQLQLESVPFDSALDLLADLEAARVETRSVRIDAAAPGRVNVQVDLAPRRS